MTDTPWRPLWLDATKDKLRRELLEIEERADLDVDEKVARVRRLTCVTCAALATQPLPFADLFVLTPIQGLMGAKIAQIHGIRLSEQQAIEVLKELGGLVGLGVLAQHFAIALYKAGVPFLGAITTIPLVYGLTYAIGTVMDHYFRALAKDRPLDREALVAVFHRARRQGQTEGEAKRAEILAVDSENNRPGRQPADK